MKRVNQMEQKFFLTQEGIDELKKEVDYLKNVKRKEVIQDLQDARAQGDLSENADYDSARDEQGIVESRISEIENMLLHAEIIVKTGTDEVAFGSVVTFEYVGKDRVKEYEIVGTQEANPLSGKISNESPLAKASMGHHSGDTVTVQAPAGEYQVIIKEVK